MHGLRWLELVEGGLLELKVKFRQKANNEKE
jgi:hypothetical protein